MKLARDRLKVMNAKCVWKIVSVPANDVQRMIGMDVHCEPVTAPDKHFILSSLIVDR